MAKPTTDTEATIEALLEQRSQYEEWILRLDTSGDKASPAVRQRVRGDYEAGSSRVMEQLRGRSAAIAEELERQHASQAELDRERRPRKRRWPRPRCATRWASTPRMSGGGSTSRARRSIEQLRARLARHRNRDHPADRNPGADRGSPRRSGSSGAAASAAPPARAPRPEIIEQAPLVTHLADEPEPPAPSHAARGSRPPSPVDELAFLKSVSDDEPRHGQPPSPEQPRHAPR